MQSKLNRLGIIVGGGPAPGINAVIGAATIEAINRGFNVVGFYDGFKWLISEAFDPDFHTTGLEIASVSRIHFSGGSILRASRANLADESKRQVTGLSAPDPKKIERMIGHLHGLQITHLVTIGGDGTSFIAKVIHDASKGRIRVVHVPKTIDNDLPLPHDTPTFGFSSAQFHGSQIVKNLMADAQTTGRWYLITAMGRSSGWLALSMGHATGATVTLIPEEFTGHTTVSRIADVLEGAMIKRKAMGRPDGVAILAEGLAYRLGDVEELEQLLGHAVTVDVAGHIRLADVPLGELLKRELIRRAKQRGESLTLVCHTLGYELRSAAPTPFDMSYCRSLGHGAVRLLTDSGADGTGVMVALLEGNIRPIRFEDMIDPETQRTRVRIVNVQSDFYRVARAYMIRLERSDFENADRLEHMAEIAQLTPAEFRTRYERAATRLVHGVPVADSESEYSAEPPP